MRARIKQAVLLALIFSSSSALPAAIHAAGDDRPEPEEHFSWRIRGQVSDEQGNAVVGAHVRTFADFRHRLFETKTRAGGLFQLEVTTPSKQLPAVLISDEDGARSAFLTQWELKPNKLFRVVLKPVRPILVRVVDKQEQPVPDAEVAIYATYTAIVHGRTDERGELRAVLPANAKVDWITARKSKAGFDYYENYDAFPTQDRLPTPGSVTLTLSDVRPFHVKIVDTNDKPLAGVRVMPWTIRRTGRLSYVNLSGEFDLGVTGKDGMVRFDWIPEDLHGGLSFIVHHSDYHCPQLPNWQPGKDSKGLTATLLRNAIVRGRVTLPDGRPAAGIMLQGEGRGATNMYFRGHTRTKEDGTYEMKIYPNQSTILAVTADEWAAVSHTGIRLEEGGIKENIDFKLTEGTIIQGVVTLGRDKKPSVGETATLIQKDGATQNLVRWSTSDDNGRYFFRVGPGSYNLMLPHRGYNKPIQLTVVDEKEIVRDGHAVRPERDRLTGSVIDPDGKPVKGGKVYGESSGRLGHAGFSSTITPKGGFATERWTDPMVLFAQAPDQGLVGFQQIDEDAKNVTLKLKAGGTVTGVLFDAEGQPLIERSLMLTVKLTLPNARWFNIPYKTDAEGRYRIPAVVVDHPCAITILVNNQYITGPEFKLKSAEVTKLDDFRLEK